LACHHHDLTTVMSLVRHEVGQHVSDVKREIAPDIALRGWDLAFCIKAQLEKSLDPGATQFQRGNELPGRDTSVIDPRGSRNAVLPSERLDPHAPGVVKVGSNRADRALWHPRNCVIPECRGKALDELNRDPVIRPPGGNETRLQIA
jgi:hypothetical protein